MRMAATVGFTLKSKRARLLGHIQIAEMQAHKNRSWAFKRLTLEVVPTHIFEGERQLTNKSEERCQMAMATSDEGMNNDTRHYA